MKTIKIFGLAALAALMAMAFVGASSAMAEGSTSLCKVDGATCAAGNLLTHVHEQSVGHALFLSIFHRRMRSLILGDTLNGGLGNPLIIHGNFTYRA